MRAPLPCPLGCVEDVSKPCGIHHNIDCCRDHHTVVPPKPRRLPPLPANIDSDPAEDYIAELTEQLRKSQAEVYRMMVVNQDLREWWSASSSAMRDKRREHLMRST